MKIVDLYKILEIPSTATSSEIKVAYKKQALRFHPDKNESGEAEEKFKSIKNAYEILSDESKRKFYDNARLNPTSWNCPPPPSASTDKNSKPHPHPNSSANFRTARQIQLSMEFQELTTKYNRKMMEHNVKKTNYNTQRTKEPTVKNLYEKYLREAEYYQLKVEAIENETLYYELEKIYNQLQKENGVQVGYFEKQIEDCEKKIETTQSRIDYFQEQANLYLSKVEQYKQEGQNLSKPIDRENYGSNSNTHFDSNSNLNTSQEIDPQLEILLGEFRKGNKDLESKFILQYGTLLKKLLEQSEILINDFDRQQSGFVHNLKRQGESLLGKFNCGFKIGEQIRIKLMQDFNSGLESRIERIQKENLNSMRRMYEQNQKFLQEFQGRNRGLVEGVKDELNIFSKGVQRAGGNEPLVKKARGDDDD